MWELWLQPYATYSRLLSELTERLSLKNKKLYLASRLPVGNTADIRGPLGRTKAAQGMVGAAEAAQMSASSGSPERQMIVLLKRHPSAADQGPHTVRLFRATAWQGHDR